MVDNGYGSAVQIDCRILMRKFPLSLLISQLIGMIFSLAAQWSIHTS